MTVTTTSHTVKLVVYSDLTCPWCYIGRKEILNALDKAKDLPLTYEIEYRPYKINASLSEDLSVDAFTYLNGKLGPERFKQIKQIVETKGNSLGITFKWNGKISQTTRAHRLMLKAWQVGGQDLQSKLLDIIFVSRWEKMEDQNDVSVLARLADEAGVMSAEQAESFYETDECLDEVVAMQNEACRNGVTGVPFTIVENKWAIAGGQSAEVYVQIFNKLADCYASRGLCQPRTPRMGQQEVTPIAPQLGQLCGTQPTTVCV